MYTLYYRPTCPFCQRVMQMAENFNIELDLRDVSESDDFLSELLEKGGEGQVPYLIDTERGVSLYESDDIIDYLREQAKASVSAESSPARPRIHIGGSTCVSCEG